MARVADVRKPSGTHRSRVLLEPRLADLFRRVCKHLDRHADEVFEEMLVLFVDQRTGLELVYENEPETEPGQGIFETQQVPLPAPGVAERRTGAKGRGTKKPVPGSAKAPLNPKKKRRRKAD